MSALTNNLSKIWPSKPPAFQQWVYKPERKDILKIIFIFWGWHSDVGAPSKRHIPVMIPLLHHYVPPPVKLRDSRLTNPFCHLSCLYVWYGWCIYKMILMGDDDIHDKRINFQVLYAWNKWISCPSTSPVWSRQIAVKFTPS